MGRFLNGARGARGGWEFAPPRGMRWIRPLLLGIVIAGGLCSCAPGGPSREAAPTTHGGRVQRAYFTAYGYNDNDDGAGHFGTAAIAYPDSRHAIATEGTGAYNDPGTFATDPREIPPHTLIYVPYLRKYFVMEDGCGECETDWESGHAWHVDLYMGGNTGTQAEPALNDCEDAVTRDDVMIIAPGPGYPVDTTPLFNHGVCSAVQRATS